MDTNFAPTGLLEKDKITFNAESLDRLDYFIAQLQKNGIYANLNLHVAREYPGFQKWEGAPNYFKGVDNFFPPMIEQQRDYARQLLTHVNPYTGKAYTDEPAVAFIEINNENGLIMEWNNATLDAMPDPFAAEFQRQWNDWLTHKYHDQAKLAAAWEPGAEPLGNEMLSNARTAWNLEQHGDAKASVEIDLNRSGETQVMIVYVTQPGKEGWHVQAVHGGLTFAKGKTYTVNLRAKSDTPRKIAINLSQAHEPWKVFASHDVNLTSDWQEIHFSVPINDTEEKARLTISNLATATGDVWLSGISLRPGGIIALKDGEKLGAIPFFRKKEIGSRTLAAQRDWNEFLVDTETNYWTGMQRFIRDDLHAHSLVLGTATGFSPWIVQSKLDVVDAHSYWQHPHFPHKPWDPNDWTVKNIPMTGAEDGGALAALAFRRVKGKPFIVTEYNASAPNSYSSEAFLELCALAALQDWDGVFVFAYSHRLNDWDTKRITSFFDIDQHPTKMATLPAALALFMRADIKPEFDHRATIVTTAAAALESVRTNGSWVDAGSYGMPREYVFGCLMGMYIPDRGRGRNITGTTLDRSISNSLPESLRWDTDSHRMIIFTPRSVGFVGSVKAGEEVSVNVDSIHITPGPTKLNWATINATVMEGDNFEHAHKILLTATGTAENTGMKWKDAEHTSVGSDWGTAPSVVEGINAKITLPAIRGAKAWALDGTGQRMSEVPLTRNDHGRMQIELSSAQKTLWWEISVP